MSKSILVIDTPKNCSECKMHYEEDDPYDYYETIDRCLLLSKYRVLSKYGKVPHDCPLKPLPQKMLAWHNDSSDDYQRGYNQCLGEIIGQEECEDDNDGLV